MVDDDDNVEKMKEEDHHDGVGNADDGGQSAEIFTGHFWGLRNEGYEALAENNRRGRSCCKDLMEMLKERVSIEETYSKQLKKLAKWMMNKDISSHGKGVGTFSPSWNIIAGALMDYSCVHHQFLSSLGLLINEVKNIDEGRKTDMSLIKNLKVPEIFETMDTANTKVLKAKQKYYSSTEGGGNKGHEDIHKSIARYTEDKANYERILEESVSRFEDMERKVLKSMRNVACEYGNLEASKFNALKNAETSFSSHLSKITVEHHLTEFVQSRATNGERPVDVIFPDKPELNVLECIDLTHRGHDVEALSVHSATSEKAPKRRNTGLLRITRKKDKSKRKGSDANSDDCDAGSVGSTASSAATMGSVGQSLSGQKFGDISLEIGSNITPDNDSQIDSEGFSIPNVDPQESYRASFQAGFSNRTNDGGGDSSSGFTSDEDDHKPKLKIKIKDAAEATQASTNIDSFKIPPINVVPSRMRSRSGSIQSRRPSSSGMTGAKSLQEESNSIDETSNVFGSDSGTATIENETESLSIDDILSTAAERAKYIVQTRRDSNVPLMPILSPRLISSAPSSRRSSRRSSTLQTPPPSEFSSSSLTFSMDVAVTEVVSAVQRGSEVITCVISGEVAFSLSPDVIHALRNHEGAPLSFQLQTGSRLIDVFPNDELIQPCPNGGYQFLTAEVVNRLEAAPEGAKHVVLDVLKYNLTDTNVSMLPLRACTIWECDDTSTDVSVHLQLNPRMELLTSFAVSIPVDGGVTSHSSTPVSAAWNATSERLLWELPVMRGKGVLKSVLAVSSRTNPGVVAFKFACIGKNLSCITVISNPGSVLGIGKCILRFGAGSYISEPDASE